MFSKQFWFSDTGVLVRAIRTFAQTAVSMIGVGTTNLFSADLKNILAVASTAAVLSILMSMDRSSAAVAAVTGTPVEILPVALKATTPAAADYQPAAAMIDGPGCGGDMR